MTLSGLVNLKGSWLKTPQLDQNCVDKEKEAASSFCPFAPLRELLPGAVTVVAAKQLSTFPIDNVKLRVKQKAALSNNFFFGYIACTGNAGKQLDFSVPFKSISGRLPSPTRKT